ncbi:uncharacterized protein [Bos taurus]|uniref:uncharacterized protein isoform X4 n=1 Tax=Bos taurus TaxID=9913 RepID=UPI0028CB2C02|nr:uncharacterized protein LOC790886 isoform X4 [Bos taurus]
MLMLINVLLTLWFYTAHGQGKHCNYPVIRHGRLYQSYSGYFPARVNQQFLYNCDQYFVPPSLYSSDYLTCTAEGWFPEEPCLRECIFNNLENGYTPSSERKAVQGETVRVRCYYGYSLQNNQNTMTCTESGWSPPPRCIRVKNTGCSQPPQIDHGTINSSSSAEERREIHEQRLYAHGTKLSYTCEEGFKISENNVIICHMGKWSSPPQCVDVSCVNPPQVENAIIHNQKSRYQSGERARYECIGNYDLFGETEVICLNGIWTEPPQCKDSQGKCGPPPPIDNGDITSLLQSVYLPGSIVEYRCQAYYELRGNRNVVCRNGEWSEPPKCLGKPCSYPVIKHGRLYYSYRGYFPARVNQQFVYSCDHHFVPPSQRSWDHLTCTAEGWSPEEPCLRQCIFNYLENGHNQHPEEKYLQGETVRVRCYEGYSLQNDQNTMTCTESGWSPPPRCIRVKTCSKSNIRIENGFLSESTFTYPLNKQTEYKCKPGYVTADGKTSGLITCLQNGWSTQPVCIKSCARPVFENARAKSDGTWFRLNDRLDYECLHGYENQDGHTTGSIVCGQDGWSDKAACYDSQGKCGPPPPIDNGDITSLLQSVYPPGMSVEYQCQAYYELQGNRNVVCQNGEWSEPPKCLEACVISEETMRKHHIELRWKPDTKLYFKTEDNIEFMCQHGYHPVTPEHTFRTTCREGEVVYPSCGKNID